MHQSGDPIGTRSLSVSKTVATQFSNRAGNIIFCPMIRTRHLFVLVTFLLSVLFYVDRVCISAAKGPIGHDLNLSDTQMGHLVDD